MHHNEIRRQVCEELEASNSAGLLSRYDDSALSFSILLEKEPFPGARQGVRVIKKSNLMREYGYYDAMI